MTLRKVYFDNSATTKMAPEVLDVMMPFMTSEYGNPSSIHFLGDVAAKALRISRKQIADSLGGLPSEVTFTSGGTESDNIALIGTMVSSKKKEIITSAIEHPAILETCVELRRRGFKVTILDVDNNGFIDPAKLDSVLNDDVCLVSIMAANNVIGTIQNISELAKVAHDHDALFHTDAVQGYTKMDINVKRDKIDLLSLSGHKIHGPKGSGAVFIRTGVPICPIMFGGGQESGLRSSTENVPGIVGLGKAAELAISTMNTDIQYMTKLRNEIIDNTLLLPNAHLNGPFEHRLCNNTHFRFDGVKGVDLILELSKKGIAASTASACSAGSIEPSHVLTAIGLSPEESVSALRVSLSRYNSYEDVYYLNEILGSIIRR